MSPLCVLFLLLPHSFAGDSVPKLSAPCGATQLTQWSLEFKGKKLTKVGARSFPDRFCEPAKPPPGIGNAQAVFLNEKKQVIWIREIQVPVYAAFDRVKSNKLTGGTVPLEETVIQLKIPWNNVTREARWLKIQMKDKEFGPTAI